MEEKPLEWFNWSQDDVVTGDDDPLRGVNHGPSDTTRPPPDVPLLPNVETEADMSEDE